MKTAILILAAGSSSRMGKIKQLLPYNQTTLLGWAIEQAVASIADEVYCVTGAHTKEVKNSIKKYNINTIYNPNYNSGLSSSIISGVRKLMEKEAILIMLADQPMISSDYLNKMMHLSIENPSKIIASAYREKRGVPAIFPNNYFSELLELKGDKGAKELLNNLNSDIITPDAIDLKDIDTPEDYQKIK